MSQYILQTLLNGRDAELYMIPVYCCMSADPITLQCFFVDEDYDGVKEMARMHTKGNGCLMPGVAGRTLSCLFRGSVSPLELHCEFFRKHIKAFQCWLIVYVKVMKSLMKACYVVVGDGVCLGRVGVDEKLNQHRFRSTRSRTTSRSASSSHFSLV